MFTCPLPAWGFSGLMKQQIQMEHIKVKQHSLKQHRPRSRPRPDPTRPRILLRPSGLQVQSALTTRSRCLIYIDEHNGGSRGGTRGAWIPPPVISRPKWGPKDRKDLVFFRRAAPAYLRVWITPRTPPPSEGLNPPMEHVWTRTWS